LKGLLQQNHRFIFSLIHKFNQDVNPHEPYSRCDDIIVISDEAHRTQAGKLARNMRLALPNAAFIGFTGTPLFKHDHLTKRIFGTYVSRYDFKRSEEDGATVKLVYENSSEKLGIARLDLNDRIADAIAKSELDPDEEALLEKLLGQDYEVITAADRLDKIAADFVEHFAGRWESRRFEILARQVFIRFKALIMEPSAFSYAERHDNIEAIYKKLEERRDTSDVTDLLKELHRIVNEAIRAAEQGDNGSEVKFYDLTQIDLKRLRDEFAKKVRRKAAALKDICQVVQDKLAQMVAENPLRMDYYRKYSEIIADYNREKDRVAIEETFAKLVDLANSLSAEQRRAAEEGLSEEELALFDLLKKDNLSKTDRERVKLASRSLLESVRRLLGPLERWTEKEQTQAEVEVLILDRIFESLPTPPFDDDEKQEIARLAYQHIWQQSARGSFLTATTV
jgi:type I site-specific restriction-modification system R (restriction) subunit